jgi:asparagine synthase (glutamine-hydrolysing)
MSAIAGLVRLDATAPIPGAVDGMLAPMHRRAPDRRDSWQAHQAGLGQALLATTPEARHERQPWQDPASGCVVVSDSRLDERADLARELELRFDDIDRLGDGELLLAAWRRWAHDCPRHLRGDFAFAIWDPASSALFCARDRFGVRPFYYHHAPGRLFAFASEPAALLALPEIPADLDEGRLVDALVPILEGIDKTSTFFRELRRLPPAHMLQLSPEGTLETRGYWRPLEKNPFPEGASDSAWMQGLLERLDRAVQRCLRSDAAVGSMLSGGLDSSAIVALAMRHRAVPGQPPLPTFSAITHAPGCAETAGVEAMLSQLSLDATKISPEDVELLERLASAREGPAEPFDGTVSLLSCLYLAASRKGVRAVLDGIDADNLLSHGDYLQDLLAQGHWTRAWREARDEARFHGSAFSPWELLRPWLVARLLPARLRPTFKRARDRSRAGRLAAEAGLSPAVARHVDLAGRLRRLQASVLAGHHSSRDGVRQTSLASPLGTAGIERYGRVAAAHGVEPRHPFLDVDLVDFAAWIPPHLLLRQGFPKWALRKAMAGRMPDAVAWRQGKEHLGPDFNRAYLDQLRTLGMPPHPRLLACLSPDALAALDGDAGKAHGIGWEEELSLRNLNRWLHAQRPS